MSMKSLASIPSESERFNEKHVRRTVESDSGTKCAQDDDVCKMQVGVLDIAGGDADETTEERKLAYASSSVIKFYPEWCQCMDCVQGPVYIGQDATCMEIAQNACRCPPSGPIARIFTFLLEFFFTWIFLWILLKNVYGNHRVESPASPRGPIFALTVLEILGLCLGILFKCFRLPSLLGPLLLGILLRNIEFINIFRNFEGFNHQNCDAKNTKDEAFKCHADGVLYANAWIQPIRLIALSLILTRAGLELSPKQLKKLKGVVPLLAFGPCCVEAVTCAIATFFIFWNENISITMCFVAGFALAAVSPAVVVPGMLSLKRRRLGEAQGVPTLLIAASSIDDVLAISLYTIFLGLAVASPHSNNKWLDYTSGILGFAVGIIHGFVMGIFLHFIPARDLKILAVFRLILLLVINITTMLFYEHTEVLAGAGSVAVLVCSFIASFRWRSEKHWKKPMGEIEHHLAHLWTLVVPLLFGTIGKEMDFSSKGYTMGRIGKVIGVIFISLTVRCLTAFFIVKLAKLNFKERVFCMASWIPKATVQAALAPLVIGKIQEIMEDEKDPNKLKDLNKLLEHGQIVVLTAVFAVLITAPLGSVLIAFLGPRFLQIPSDDQKVILDEEFPGGDGDISLMDVKDLGELSKSEDEKSAQPENDNVLLGQIRIEVIDPSERPVNIAGSSGSINSQVSDPSERPLNKTGSTGSNNSEVGDLPGRSVNRAGSSGRPVNRAGSSGSSGSTG